MDRYFCACGGEARECSRKKEQLGPKPGTERLPSSGEFLPWKITLTLFKVGVTRSSFQGIASLLVLGVWKVMVLTESYHRRVSPSTLTRFLIHKVHLMYV